MSDNTEAEALAPTRFVRTDVSLEVVMGEAASLPGPNAGASAVFVLAHTPQTARVLRLDRDGTLHDERGAAWPSISQTFELRFFCENAEMAWRRGGETGRAVLTRDDGQRPLDGWTPQTTSGFEKLAEGDRLLWGELDKRSREPLAPGWSRLSAPRVGTIYVPLQHTGAEEAKPRAVLTVVEYARVAEDGNVVPCGERLKGFNWR
jgi:CRISPR-associated protein (TIGR03984 family)